MISHNLSFIQNGFAIQSSVDDLHLPFMMRDYTNHQLDTLTIPSSNLVSITTLQGSQSCIRRLQKILAWRRKVRLVRPKDLACS